MTNRKAGRPTTSRQADRPKLKTDRQTDRQTQTEDRQTERQTDLLTLRQTDTQTDRQTERQRDLLTLRQADTQTDTDRHNLKTDRQTDTTGQT